MKKQELMVTNVQYLDTEYEKMLKEWMGDVIVMAESQGKQHGLQNTPRTLEEYYSLVLNGVEIEIQKAINLNQQRFLPISGMVVVRLIEEEAATKKSELQREINDVKRTLSIAERQAKKLQPDVKRMLIRKFVFIGLGFLGFTEGFLSYPAFRHTGFQIIPAFLGSIAVAFGVGVGSHFLGGYIKAAQSNIQRFRRYLIALIPAVIGFSVLGIMRTNVYQHVTNLEPDALPQDSSPQAATIASAVAVFSILLYWLAVYISSKFFRTKEERLQEHAYEEKCDEVRGLQKEIKAMEKEIESITERKMKEINMAGRIFEYARYMEQQLINFAQEVVEAYKQKNRNFRTDGCPTFFHQKPIFRFERFFNNLKITKNETA